MSARSALAASRMNSPGSPFQTRKRHRDPFSTTPLHQFLPAARRPSRTGSTRAWKRRPPGMRSEAVSMTLTIRSSARSLPATSNASFVAGADVGDRSGARSSCPTRRSRTT